MMAKKKTKKASKKKISTKLSETNEKEETITSIAMDDVLEGEIVEKEAKELDSKPTREIKEYRPTPLQVKYLHKSLEMMTDNVSAITEAVGMNRTTYYEWVKDQAYIDWFMDEWNKKIKMYGATLDAIGMAKAKKGDHKFWRDMQRIAGRMQDTPGTGQTFLQMNVNFIDQEGENGQ